MLKSLTIKNFKSFKDATLQLAPLTLMIGANASGKSNAIEALQYITNVLLSHLQEFKNMFSEGKNLRGNGDFIKNDKNIPLEYDIILIDPKNNIEYSFSISQDGKNDAIFNEKYIENNMILHEANNTNLDDFISQLFFTKSINDTACSDTDISVLKRNEIKKIQVNFLYNILGSFVLDIIPDKMRHYSQEFFESIGRNGENLSGTLFQLCKDAANKEIILDFIQQLPEQNIVDIGFIEVKERGEVMVKLIEKFGDKEFSCDASLLSDGTLRALAIVAFLLSYPESALFIIEEIDNGIHPSRIKDFMAKVYRLAAERKIQVLMTSHNPALLDAIPDESLEDVVCCYRDKDEGDSRFVRLGDLHLYPELVAQGSLGDLVTGGILERYVHDKRTPAEIKQEALDWFDDFYAKHEVAQ